MSTPVVRSASLPGGRQLVVRPVDAGDVDGLERLYAGLDDDARYRRFFSLHHPSRSFFDGMAAVTERGGAGLVATVAGDDALAQLVAEASYELLPNGNGELAITVDRAWRGWLGPYLFDALLEVAASRGVPNLEAVVLLTNRPMLALLRARGCAAVPEEDWTVAHLVVGADGRTPTWPRACAGPRVLIEGRGGAHWRATAALQAAGFELIACSGPEDAGRTCPAVHGEACPLAAGADAIILSHPPATPAWDCLRAAHPRLHPGVPVGLDEAGDEAAAVADRPVLPGDDVEVAATVRGWVDARSDPAVVTSVRARRPA